GRGYPDRRRAGGAGGAARRYAACLSASGLAGTAVLSAPLMTAPVRARRRCLDRPCSSAISLHGCPVGPEPAVRQTAWQTRIPAAGSVDCPGFNDPNGSLTGASPA